MVWLSLIIINLVILLLQKITTNKIYILNLYFDTIKVLIDTEMQNANMKFVYVLI